MHTSPRLRLYWQHPPSPPASSPTRPTKPTPTLSPTTTPNPSPRTLRHHHVATSDQPSLTSLSIRVICGSDKKPGQNGTAAITAHPPIQPIPIQTTTTSVSTTDALKPVIFADSLYFLNSTSQNFARNPLTRTARLYYHGKCTHIWSQIDGSGQLIKSKLDERIRTNTLTASTDTFKITESIGDRVGGYNFLPTLIESCSRRKQCPLYLVNSESSFLGCAGNDRCIKGWSRGAMQPSHHKPIDSARVGTGQSRRRGRVRCQSLFIAGERRRCEPGSNSVIVTNALTSVEGHVVGLGGLQRTRKIFVGCPAIRPIWDQSPGIRNPRLETVGNRLYPLHDQDCLRRSTAEAQIQDRSRAKTGPNTAPAFSRVSRRLSRAGGNPGKNQARHLPLPRRREPREKQSTPIPPLRAAQENDDRAQATEPAKRPSGGCPRIINTQPHPTSSTT